MRVAHNRTHGMSDDPIFGVWQGMLNRCRNKNVKSYQDYGGRGIYVCDRWQGERGLENFIADMGQRPSELHSIERIDNGGPYSPDNCRWATREEQVKNKRNNHHITANGETLTLQEWARRLGCSHATILMRIKYGMTEQESVSFPAYQPKITELTAIRVRKAYPLLSMQRIADALNISKKSVLNILHGKLFPSIATIGV